MEQPTATSLDIPDLDLIDLVLKGEKRYFEHIIRRYNQRLFRVGMSILYDDSEVEDAMQNAYISAFLHLGTFQSRSSFSTWLTRIMLNECLEQKRKNQLKSKIGDSIRATQIKMPDSELMNKELNTILEKTIAGLPEKYRLVFMLREIEDLSVRETSETLSIEEVNVKVRLNRAKVMLRKSLDGYVKEHAYHFHLTRCDRIVLNVMDRLSVPHA